MRPLLLLLIIVGSLAGLRAQECLPDPGPALFFENFGSGTNFGPPLPSGTTGYAYNSTETGGYVLSNTSDLDPYFWHPGEDHTDDEDGYMLLFNAAPGPGIFYQRTFTDLCPNTDYIFSAYIANIAVPTACIGVAFKPDVRFSILDPADESVLFTNTTGEIFYSSFLNWIEYGIRFRTTADQTTVLIRLTNNGIAGCGNDLAFDDLSLRYCNPQIEQIFDLCELPGGAVTVGDNTYAAAGTYQDALPVPGSCNDTLVTTVLTGDTRILPTERYDLCAGDTLLLADTFFTSPTTFVDTVPGPTPDCPWFQPYEIGLAGVAAFEQTVTLCGSESHAVGAAVYTEAGTYVDTLTSAAGCDSILRTTILTGDISVSVAPAAVEVEAGGSVQLTAQVDLSSDFVLSWRPAAAFSCADCPDPVLRPESSGVYTLIATDVAAGCVDSAQVTVTVPRCDRVFIPNVFTPNGDGVNDRVELFAEACFTRVVEWRIFDRWGGQVFALTDQQLTVELSGWDGSRRGRPAAAGVYAYRIVLEREDGARQLLTGDLILLK